MPTRAAVKREAALAAKTWSSPPTTSSTPESAAGKSQSAIHRESVAVITGVNESNTKLLAPLAIGNIKSTSAKDRKKHEPVRIELDVLPHGLGRKGDLLGEAAVENQASTIPPVSGAVKRKGRGKATSETDDISMTNNNGGVKAEEQTDVESQSKSETASTTNKLDPVTVDLLEKSLPRKHRVGAGIVKAEEDETDDEDEDFGERPKKKRALSRRKTLNVSKDVLEKVEDMLNASGQPPTKIQKKSNKYGLTPGETPFPDYPKPTPEDCEEVNRLLSALHGEVKPPDVIPPPSMKVTGCGEVPDLLDAILRTLLSASTTANNANLALHGLKEKFHLRESGIGKGSINWEAVHKADLDEVIDAIKSGGLAKVKGTNIKKILDVVHQQNCARRDALLEEKETGEPANIPGAENMTSEQKDTEIAKAEESMLSMDHLFEMTTDEAMEEMTKLPGIGVKTASCVILFCMKRPSFAVDTHVWRHCKWLGWVPETATRDQTFSHCEVRVPDHLKYSLHQLFLKHGKTCGRCRANTSAGTEDWKNTDCPIDHLLNRTGKRKSPPNSSVLQAKSGNKKKGAKKGKMQDEETEESSKPLSDEADNSGSEYNG